MRLALVPLILILLAPAAAAAPFHASLEDAREPRLAGEATAWAERGVLDLTPAAMARAPFALAADEGHATLVRVETRRLSTLTYVSPLPATTDSDKWATGELRVTRCGAVCKVFLVAEGAGRVGIEGASGGLAWSAEEGRFCSDTACTAPPPYEAHRVPPGAWRIEAGEGSVARAEGGLLLVARDAVLEWRSGGARHVLDALVRQEEQAPGVVVEEHRFLVARLAGARLSAPAGTPAALHAEDVLVALVGVFSTPEATGTVTMDGERARLHAEPLDVRGDLTLALRGRAEPVVRPDAPVRATGEIEGEASSLRAGGLVVTTRAPAPDEALVAMGLAALLALVLLLVPAYSRITRSRILANANRARIHQILTDAPGRTVPDLSRATGLAKVVVRHHLAILHAHGAVVRRADGRLRRYYPAGNAPPAAQIAREGALSVATRRALAEALAAFPDGATQRQLMERTGLSQRLVSYHLARLHEAGLVEVEPGLPKKYHARAGDASRGPPG